MVAASCTSVINLGMHQWPAPATCYVLQVISVAAGVTLKTMEQALGPHVRVVRVMPNTPALGALLR